MARIDATFRLNVNGWYEFGKAYSGGPACYRGPVSRDYRVVRFYVVERSCDLRALRCIVCGFPELSVQVPPRPAAVAPRRSGPFGVGRRAYAPAGASGPDCGCACQVRRCACSLRRCKVFRIQRVANCASVRSEPHGFEQSASCALSGASRTAGVGASAAGSCRQPAAGPASVVP